MDFLITYLPVILFVCCFICLGVMAVASDIARCRLTRKGKKITKNGKTYVLLNLTVQEMNKYYNSIMIPLIVFCFIFFAAILDVLMRQFLSGRDPSLDVIMTIFSIFMFFLTGILLTHYVNLTITQHLPSKKKYGIRFKKHGIIFTTGDSKKDKKEGTTKQPD